MARQRSESRDKAFNIYKEHNGNIKLKDIAKQLNISDVQVRKWKSKDEWEQKLKGTLMINGNVTDEKVTNEEKEVMKEIIKIDNAELTDKQKFFCIYYIKYFNATKAAIKAGYSKETATEQGSRLLTNVKVQDEIQRLKANKLKGAYLSKEDLLQKYIDIVFADITDYVEFKQETVPIMGPFGPIVIKEKGKPPKEITKVVNVVRFKNSNEVDGTIISEIKQGKDGASIKLQDKMKALDFLAKNIGLLDIETQQKLEMAREKLELETNSNEGDSDILYEVINEDEIDQRTEES